MRNRLRTLSTVLAAFIALSGCSKTTHESTSLTSEDSLLETSPIEPAEGDITPQVAWQEPPTSEPQAPRVASPTKRQVRKPASHATPAAPPSDVSAQHQAPANAATAQPPAGPAMNVMWGSFLRVAFTGEISSETARVGDVWNGTLTEDVAVDNRIAFPKGSTVAGKVTAAKPAQAGSRAMLTLELSSIDVNGRTWPVRATADPVEAGSPRARNIGSIIGGAAAGALIGQAAGGGKGAAIGGAVGGAAAGTAVARSKGYQVVIKPGSTMTFSTAQDVVVRP